MITVAHQGKCLYMLSVISVGDSSNLINLERIFQKYMLGGYGFAGNFFPPKSAGYFLHICLWDHNLRSMSRALKAGVNFSHLFNVY
jgi:hypothetical protein